jgi:protein ImuA
MEKICCCANIISNFAKEISLCRNRMSSSKADIIARLQRDILQMQGFKSIHANPSMHLGLGIINESFPNAVFPLGAMHEFMANRPEDAAASCGFIAGIVSGLMKQGGASIWISASRTLFPPALKAFGIEPDKIIFIDLQREKDLLWAMEEALKCDGLAAVIGEIKELSFVASRRLQLAVEQSQVTGFILRCNARNIGTTACISRWQITSLPSMLEGGMPGVGFPRWQVQLLKIRNGKPGAWDIEWAGGKFHLIAQQEQIEIEEQRQTG